MVEKCYLCGKKKEVELVVRLYSISKGLVDRKRFVKDSFVCLGCNETHAVALVRRGLKLKKYDVLIK